MALAEAQRTAQLLHMEDGKQREALDAMANAIVNKILHAPTMELKRQAQAADGSFLAHATRRLFRLEGDGAAGEAATHAPTEDEPGADEPSSGEEQVHK